LWCASWEKEQLSCWCPPDCRKGAWLRDDGLCCSTRLSSVLDYLAFYGRDGLNFVIVLSPAISPRQKFVKGLPKAMVH
jgi:hypothetical protein